MDYKTKGVCSQQIHFEIEDNKIHNVSFVGGCNGNLQGISHLVEGMDVDEAISRLEGIQCGFKTTSCPDQLAKALKELTLSFFRQERAPYCISLVLFIFSSPFPVFSLVLLSLP